MNINEKCCWTKLEINTASHTRTGLFLFFQSSQKSERNSLLDKYKLLSDRQYGFRSNQPTSVALKEFNEEIANATDDKKYVGVLGVVKP